MTESETTKPAAAEPTKPEDLRYLLDRSRMSLLDHLVSFCLRNKLIITLLTLLSIGAGVIVAPFDWKLEFVERNPVPVDAIPDIGENQQIVFTAWMGRSPQDIEDQITYPLTAALLGVPGVRSVRSYSFFGFSSIYLIFNEDVEFYWSRSRVLEKLNSLPRGTLPDGVAPTLGPDATALGQVYWYTLEGRDADGKPTGGWDLHELRTIQDYEVRYALQGAEGIAEVASIGGFVQEYQIDIDPDALRVNGVTLEQVFLAVRMSNVDVGARTIEINRAEYVIRGLGFIKSLDDIRNTVVKARDTIPIRIQDVAKVSKGPALRRGALDKSGAEVVGGVAVVRYGYNPLKAIQNLKAEIEKVERGLPTKTLSDGSVSELKVVPFYDRTGLIHETLDTLNEALRQEILITIIVVLVMVLHLRSSLLISGLLPLAVLLTFVAMKIFGVDANVVALSGIAIAIGTMVDMGIVLCENILRHLDRAPPGEDRMKVVYQATSEVGGAVLTAVLTTVVSFLPVFVMEAAEGKLFKPLAYTKTFALLASIIVALTVIPPFAHLLFTGRLKSVGMRRWLAGIGVVAGVLACWWIAVWVGLLLAFFSAYHLAEDWIPERVRRYAPWVASGIVVVIVALFLTFDWLPLGPERGGTRNFILVAGAIASLLGFFQLFQMAYPRILRWCLEHKLLFLALPAAAVVLGLTIWLGFDRVFFFLPKAIRSTAPVTKVAHAFPGLGKEFMPSLDEGSFLYMPTTMPHASIGEALDVMQKLDMAMSGVPEVDSVVGKLGRVESALDPAPISMFENLINYKSQYLRDEEGKHRLRFRYDANATDTFRNPNGVPVSGPDGEPYIVQGKFERDADYNLIPDPDGYPFRLWRRALDPGLNPDREAWEGIRSPKDIWDELVRVGEIPGTTSAPKLQPIETRLVMLQTGMRAPMGVKVYGPDLETIEKVALDLEGYLKKVPSVVKEAVLADRVVGKPYIEIDIDREAIARYGLHVRAVQDVIEVAVGGKPLTYTVEGRERFPVRVRYLRELRDQVETLATVLVAAPGGAQVPLRELAEIRYVRGPQMIKSEDSQLVAYVILDKRPGTAEVDVVHEAEAYLLAREEEFKQAFQDKSKQLGRDLTEDELAALPGLNTRGCKYKFSGSYENQIRSEKRMRLVLPLALFVIFMILYMQFRSAGTTAVVFSGVIVAASGGFLMLWLYGQDWFLDFSLFGANMRDLFQVRAYNLSVAVWVGFIALFGIATDDGVVIATYLDQSFKQNPTETKEGIRAAVLEAGQRRVRPCLMTTATTILALLPVLTSTGRGSDIMVPMAIPSFGGMALELLTMFVVPVLYCWIKEFQLRWAAPVSMAPALG